jgi:probable DNA repair protein
MTRAVLFERLALGRAERLTVLTPNLRLARALEAEVDEVQVATGRASWEAPDILPFPAFVQRGHEEALYAAGGAEVPTLLTDVAARILWEEVIRASDWGDDLLSVPSTAALAAEAWSLAHAWRIENALRDEAFGEDAAAFVAWAGQYARRTARDNLVDTARLPALVAPLLASGAIEKPATLVVYAFDLLKPQESDLLEACERAGIAVFECDPFEGSRGEASRVTRTLLESPRAELEHAARWARARLEDAAMGSAPRIGIVVPDLAQRRKEAGRIFSRTLAPGARPGERRAPLFDFSLGEPLDARPLVDAALGVLELASGPVAYDRVSRILRSPFIDGAEAELADRARLDAALRAIAPASLNLLRLRTAISQAVRKRGAPECPRLIRLFDRVLDASHESPRAGPHEWSRRFTKVLEGAGFPGERSLDSAEYQTLEKWRRVLGDLAVLGLVAPAWSASEARARLQRLCAETIFQPESGQAPVEILGLLESQGLAFDHLWVCGLTEDAWPLSSRPHPLIAPALQRKAGIPQASPEQALEVDRRITEAWKRAAPEVVFSSAGADGDRELLPSPLVAGLDETLPSAIGIPDYVQLRRALFAAGGRKAMTRVHDDNGPGVAQAAVKGGSRILVDQAACPFRAFAHFRLDAQELERPEHGLGPLERGTLLHEMMGHVWATLKDYATLVTTGESQLQALALEAARLALERVRDDRPGRLDGRFAELEQRRLAQVAVEWLSHEKERRPFKVVKQEESMTLKAGGLQISGRIDRMDQLEDGGLAVIDYKSGRVSVGAWLGQPPDDAQLPLYALAADHDDVRVVTFARLKTGDRGFAGLARDADAGIPGVTAFQKHRDASKIAQTWSELFAFWQREVDGLGDNFAAGDARVDPKLMLRTCERCDLKSLCRVHERLGALDEGEPFEEPTGDEEELP